MAKVLILDQSKSVRNNLRERLEFEGFSTEGAESTALARSMCEKIPFDLILADNADGLAETNLPFIVLSRENDIESEVRHNEEVIPQFVSNIGRIAQMRVEITHHRNNRFGLTSTLVAILYLEQRIDHLLNVTAILGYHQTTT